MAMPAPSSTQIAGKNGTEYTVEGPILAKWETLTDEQKKDLGAPYDNQKNTLDNTGVYQQYDDGVLIYKNGGPVYLVWGKIRDAWNDVQASQGKLGCDGFLLPFDAVGVGLFQMLGILVNAPAVQ